MSWRGRGRGLQSRDNIAASSPNCNERPSSARSWPAPTSTRTTVQSSGLANQIIIDAFKAGIGHPRRAVRRPQGHDDPAAHRRAVAAEYQRIPGGYRGPWRRGSRSGPVDSPSAAAAGRQDQFRMRGRAGAWSSGWRPCRPGRQRGRRHAPVSPPASPWCSDKLGMTDRNLREIRTAAREAVTASFQSWPDRSARPHAALGARPHQQSPERKIGRPRIRSRHAVRPASRCRCSPRSASRSPPACVVLRADPDVIMVGEMSDRGDGRDRIEASLTGHLVFSTLHTNSAGWRRSSAARHGAGPVQLRRRAAAVVAQRLVRRICVDCREGVTSGAGRVRTSWPHGVRGRRVPEDGGESTTTTSSSTRGKGCGSCESSGYRGRVGIHEVMVATVRHEEAHPVQARVVEMVKVAKERG